MRTYYYATKLDDLYLADNEANALMYHALSEARKEKEDGEVEHGEVEHGNILVLEIPFDEDDAAEVNKGKEDIFNRITHVCNFDMRVEQKIGYNIAWIFMHDKYDSIEEFRNALVSYNERLDIHLNKNDLDSVCVDSPGFVVSNHSSCELWKEENFCVTLYAKNGKNFTIVELLYKLNNWLFDHSGLFHHVYFGGISPDGEIDLGS